MHEVDRAICIPWRPAARSATICSAGTRILAAADSSLAACSGVSRFGSSRAFSFAIPASHPPGSPTRGPRREPGRIGPNPASLGARFGDATRANTVAHGARPKTCEIQPKSCCSWLELPRGAWLMCDTERQTNHENQTMNANQIAFGIEFETTLPASDTTPIGPYHHGYQVPWLPEGCARKRTAAFRSQPIARPASSSAQNCADQKASRRSKRRSTRSRRTERGSTRVADCMSRSNGRVTRPLWPG